MAMEGPWHHHLGLVLCCLLWQSLGFIWILLLRVLLGATVFKGRPRNLLWRPLRALVWNLIFRLLAWSVIQWLKKRWEREWWRCILYCSKEPFGGRLSKNGHRAWPSSDLWISSTRDSGSTLITWEDLNRRMKIRKAHTDPDRIELIQ